MREIGSEFCPEYDIKNTTNKDNEVYLLSGRTALNFIVKDICCDNNKARKALLPSYCCESMILPFLSSSFEVRFYSVVRDAVDYPYDNDADVILLVDFFGFGLEKNIEIARRAKQDGKIVIYDATHKLDGNPEIEAYADYSFCSYRKWFYCNFAVARKYSGTFSYHETLTVNKDYVDLRDRAAREKERYLAGYTDNKKAFLADFSAAEESLDKDYIGYSGTPVAFDINKIVSKRRQNAACLINELKNIPDIKLWRDTIGSNDTPMFVPVLVSPQCRNDLRGALISEGMYCPVHWPKTVYHGDCNELYDMEISLVCDQRYDEDDMRRIAREIKKYFNR